MEVIKKNVKVELSNAGEGKLDDLTNFLVKENIEWVWVCETQWEDNIRAPSNSVGFIPGMKHLHGRAHYGTGILLNPKLLIPPFEILHVAENGNVQVWRWNGALFVGLYIPPNDDDTKWANIISHALTFGKEGEATFLLGDYNMRIGAESGDSNWNRRGRILFKHLREHSLKHHQDQKAWTFRNGAGCSTVDYIFTNLNVIVEETEIYQHDLRSEHAMVMMKACYVVGSEIPRPSKYHIWNLKKLSTKEERKEYLEFFKENYLQKIISKIRQSLIETQEECDTLDTFITNSIMECADEFIGQVTRYKGRSPVTSPRLMELNEACKIISMRIETSMGTQNHYISLYKQLLALRNEALKEAEILISEQWYDYVEGIERKPQGEMLKIIRRAKETRLRNKINLLRADKESLDDANFFESQFSRPEGSINYPEYPEALESPPTE